MVSLGTPRLIWVKGKRDDRPAIGITGDVSIEPLNTHESHRDTATATPGNLGVYFRPPTVPSFAFVDAGVLLAAHAAIVLAGQPSLAWQISSLAMRRP
jgi:hypothetical protein